MPFFSPQRTRVARDGAPISTPPDPAGTAATGLLRRYRPLETRATGGFGSVEICLDARLQRRVAIKRMPLASPLSRTSAETVSAALAEARTASMLQHPNIVSVIDFTYDAAYAYLVMEYVDGMNLEEFLAQVDGHSLTYDECACIADALVQALSYAHENGVLHLDIKPANVLIDRSGHVKLADFGMAMLTSAAGFGGARGGTVGYMPPEQLSGAEVDERADVFSLGCVLYEALCGTAPFRAGTPADSLARIEQGVVRPSSLLPGIPPMAEEALICSLSPRPEQRMLSVADFGERFLPGLGNAREGKRSLARMIASLAQDAEEASEEPAPAIEEREPWRFDPAEGVLGARDARARRWAVGALAAAGVTVSAFHLLGAAGLTGFAVRAVTSLACGTAAAAAPQLGSALVVTGFVVAVLNATDPLSAAPVLVAVIALAAGWWLTWGREFPAASAALVAACAGTVATGDVSAAAPAVAALAGYACPPAAAAATMGLAVPLGKLMAVACVREGLMGLAQGAEALGSPAPWISAAGACAIAAATSYLLRAAWNRGGERTGTALIAVALACPLIVVLLLASLAHPMEIAGGTAAALLGATATGCLSSILLGICVLLFGRRKAPSEGDRS